MTRSDRHPSGLLADFAEGTLSSAQAERVSRHVSACESCESEIEGWQVMYRSIGRLRRPSVSPGLHARILAAVASEVPVPAAVWAARAVARRRWVAALSWAYAAGVALVAGVGVGLAFVPAVREAAGSALARLSTAGLQAGLHSLSDRFEWVRVVGRALETLGGVAHAQLAEIAILVLFTVFFSYVFVRFLHQRDADREVSHVGLLVA
jgi:anti-sigma factor RsiW